MPAFSAMFGKKNVMDVVQAALEARAWKFHRANEDMLLTGVDLGAVKALIRCQHEQSKRALLILVNPVAGDGGLSSSGPPPFMHIHTRAGQSATQVAQVCELLLRKNYEISVGAWERDPADGEIRYRVALPYRDAIPTQEQVSWCIDAAASSIADLTRELTGVLKSSPVKPGAVSEL